MISMVLAALIITGLAGFIACIVISMKDISTERKLLSTGGIMLLLGIILLCVVQFDMAVGVPHRESYYIDDYERSNGGYSMILTERGSASAFANFMAATEIALGFFLTVCAFYNLLEGKLDSLHKALCPEEEDSEARLPPTSVVNSNYCDNCGATRIAGTDSCVQCGRRWPDAPAAPQKQMPYERVPTWQKIQMQKENDQK